MKLISVEKELPPPFKIVLAVDIDMFHIAVRTHNGWRAIEAEIPLYNVNSWTYLPKLLDE